MVDRGLCDFHRVERKCQVIGAILCFTGEMKRRLTWTLIAVFMLACGFVVLKLSVPFSYAEAELRWPAVEFVKGLQKSDAVSPEECAARYLYYQSDYHLETPERIRVSKKELSESSVRITLHDPSCHDDSIRSSINRVHFEKDAAGMWIPVRHEWSHKGRGRFGWTTKPTS